MFLRLFFIRVKAEPYTPQTYGSRERERDTDILIGDITIMKQLSIGVLAHADSLDIH